MSDLQCPAVFHVLGPRALVTRTDLVHGAPIVAVYAAPARVAEVVGALDLAEGGLVGTLEELSDVYRGEHVLVLAGETVWPLRAPDDEVVVRVDADGFAVERPDRSVS